MTDTNRAPTIETYRFADDGIVPNNPALPLVVYRGALPPGGDRASGLNKRSTAALALRREIRNRETR